MKRLGTIVMLSVVLSGFALAQTPRPSSPPSRVQLLIQSELSHLELAERRINLTVTDAMPDYTLRAIERAGQFTVEIEGQLPRAPKLTGSFREATVGEVLTWFAKQVDVVYRAEREGKLVVFPRPVRNAN